MEHFNQLALPEALLRSLAEMNFNTPTPIQAQAIPLALEGKDILGSAQTGTGKTGAFGVPLVAKLMSQPKGAALVLTPTRELAVQVHQMLEQLLGKKSTIRSALLIGGDPMPKQLQQLRAGARLIVGTPGRINDHLERGSLNLHDAGFLVLDETDRMLDMGFSVQIDRIMKFLPKVRQTLLFSATLPSNIVTMAGKYLKDPVRISVGSSNVAAANIKQDVVHIAEHEKYNQLLTELEQREGSVIVFVKTKWGAEKMAGRLRAENLSADAIHGDLRHNKRERVIQGFRKRRYRILVATDIAARGLDIPHIEHVINYDLPQCPEDYIHRIGRTARAGAEGSAICFISPAERGKWNAIDRLMNPDAKREKRSETSGRSSGSPSGKSSRRPQGASYAKKERNDWYSTGERREEKQERSFRPRIDGERKEERQERSFRPRVDGERKEEGQELSYRPRSDNRGERSQRPYQERGERSENGERPYSKGRRSVRSGEASAAPRPPKTASAKPLQFTKGKTNRSATPATDGGNAAPRRKMAGGR